MIAQILTRFRNMVMAATEPLPRDGAIVETATLNSMTMETETQALVCALPHLTCPPLPSYLFSYPSLPSPPVDTPREQH